MKFGAVRPQHSSGLNMQQVTNIYLNDQLNHHSPPPSCPITCPFSLADREQVSNYTDSFLVHILQYEVMMTEGLGS